MTTRRRVLVTGGAGFLGTALARVLVGAGEDVHLLVRPGGDRRRLAGLAGRVCVHPGDLLDPAALRAAVAAASPDVVFHLAAAGVTPGQSREAVFAANVTGTANLLAAVTGHPYRALVHVGTGAEYGRCDDPVPETAALRPVGDYAAAKAAASELCLAEAARGRPVTVVRVFGAYGPGEAPARLLPYVFGCGVRGEAPKVSAGTQRRDFVFAADVAELLRAAADTPAAAGRVLHAASGTAVPVREVVAAALRLAADDTLTPLYGAIPSRPDEPPLYAARIDETCRLTGWRPRTDLPAGLAATWDWFRGRAAPRNPPATSSSA